MEFLNKEEIKLIVGLGNPETEYSNTRHNMGFDVLNLLSEDLNIKIDNKKFDSFFVKTKIGTKDIYLQKPQTYMNNSGIAVKQIANYFKLKPENILVIYDDMDIEKGKIKIRKGANPGSHNGIKSITEQLNSKDFNRIRIGIGKPLIKELTIPYVIGKIKDEEEIKVLQNAKQLAKNAIIDIIENNMDYAMNKYN